MRLFKEFLIFNGAWKAFNRAAGGWGHFKAVVSNSYVTPENYFILSIRVRRWRYQDYDSRIITEASFSELARDWRQVYTYKRRRREKLISNLVKKLKREVYSIRFEEEDIFLREQLLRSKFHHFAFKTAEALAVKYPEIKSLTFYKLEKYL